MNEEISRGLWQSFLPHDYLADYLGEPVTDDAVDHPKHYTEHPSGVECIEIVRHMTFNVGNVFKYLWRAGLKDTAPSLEDHKKALWYLKDEIERLELEAEAKARVAQNIDAGMSYAKNKYAAGFPVELLKDITAKQAAADSFKNIEYASIRVQNNTHGDRTFSFTCATTVGQAAAKVAEAYGYASRRKFTFTRVGDRHTVTNLDLPVSDLARPSDNAILVTLAEWYGAS